MLFPALKHVFHVTATQVQLVATGEMSIICGCSGVSVLTSTGNSLVSHPNSPSLFQGEVLDEESFDLTPSVAVCDSSPPPLFCALVLIRLSHLLFLLICSGHGIRSASFGQAKMSPVGCTRCACID